jgi:hypothetical protein
MSNRSNVPKYLLEVNNNNNNIMPYKTVSWKKDGGKTRAKKKT